MVIRMALESEYEDVRQFYYSLIDALQSAQYSPGWEKGVYPADDYLRDSIMRGELYVGVSEEGIAAAMIVNHQCNESYVKAKWPTKAAPDEITVIHALGVHPDFVGRGLAKELVRYVIGMAERSRQRVVRLDVLKDNIPAERLYEGMDFEYVDTVCMFYEDTGWTDYKLYEYKL